ncbi:cell wall anchor protein [Chryseobacterium sp. PMSZPI]|uniref:cell wall anchor protein n=1 Tax=Chryseobacterium sp. PMSZPI TaxID=1033900 RepID=UPI00399F22D7
MKIRLLPFTLFVSTFIFAQSWNVTGNAGTNPPNNFMGTTDSKDLVVKTNNVERMRITSAGNVAIGGTPDDPYVPFQVYGRSQIRTNVNSDGLLVSNSFPKLDSGTDLIWVKYDNYQPNDVGLLSLSTPSFVGDWPKSVFTVRASGKILMGQIWNGAVCGDCNEYRLFVKDGIKAEKVKVESSANGWADYVFKKDYKLRSLDDVERHIAEKGHLPNIPSAQEVEKEGINLGEMDAKLLEKIEELTLYSIEQNKQLKFQAEEIRELKKQSQELQELKQQVQKLLFTQN